MVQCNSNTWLISNRQRKQWMSEEPPADPATMISLPLRPAGGLHHFLLASLPPIDICLCFSMEGRER